MFPGQDTSASIGLYKSILAVAEPFKVESGEADLPVQRFAGFIYHPQGVVIEHSQAGIG